MCLWNFENNTEVNIKERKHWFEGMLVLVTNLYNEKLINNYENIYTQAIIHRFSIGSSKLNVFSCKYCFNW